MLAHELHKGRKEGLKQWNLEQKDQGQCAKIVENYRASFAFLFSHAAAMCDFLGGRVNGGIMRLINVALPHILQRDLTVR
jgi:hypothetical protein